jgi:GR25 family glycosyltransferase involved in LPS biosynthesis
MKYFWINLHSAHTRRNKILKEFADNNITEHYRVNAYPSIDDSKRSKESACCRSHIQAMTHFLLNTNDEYALICEDDLTFELKKYWKQSVEDVVKNAPSDWGIIQLATIIQNIEPKFCDRELYFKWSEQKSSSTLAWVINRKCAIKLLNIYLSKYNMFNIPTPDCFSNGIYSIVNKHTEYISYTYKFPMFIYPDDNDSQICNSLDLHRASKRQLLQYLEKNDL